MTDARTAGMKVSVVSPEQALFDGDACEHQIPINDE